MMPVQAKLHGRRDMRAVDSVDDVVTSIQSWPRLDTRVGAMPEKNPGATNDLCVGPQWILDFWAPNQEK